MLVQGQEGMFCPYQHPKWAWKYMQRKGRNFQYVPHKSFIGGFKVYLDLDVP